MAGTHSIPNGSAIPTYLNLPIANPYHQFLAERLSDASRAVGVKLLGYRAAPAAWHPRFVLPSVAADEGERGTNYDLPPGCPELPVILTEYLRWALARKPHCRLFQVRTAHTQLRKPEIFESISSGRLAAIPGNSEPLMPNSARRRSPIRSGGSEPRMCRIGPLSSHGRESV